MDVVKRFLLARGLREQIQCLLHLSILSEWSGQQGTQLFADGTVLGQRIQNWEGKHTFPQVGTWGLP